jgi:hypothetical protein
MSMPEQSMSNPSRFFCNYRSNSLGDNYDAHPMAIGRVGVRCFASLSRWQARRARCGVVKFSVITAEVEYA